MDIPLGINAKYEDFFSIEMHIRGHSLQKCLSINANKTQLLVNVTFIWLPKLFYRHKYSMATVAQLESVNELNKL